MAFIDNSTGNNTTVIANGELLHPTFNRLSGNIESTEVKLDASDTAANDKFGFSVGAGSGRIVVGAYLEDPPGTSSGGSAYIYDLEGNNEIKIVSSDVASSDFFGYSVAAGSGRIVVGAYGDDDNGSASGSAYIFDLDGNQLAKITASDGAASDQFGGAVAVGSGRIVVGAHLDDDDGSASGSAYIFDLDGTQIAKITASDGATGDEFGFSVAVGSGRIVVGAYQDDDNGSNSGSAYIFDLDGNEIAKITASDGTTDDDFGYSVAVGSGRIVVGAPGDGLDGSAYIFDLDGTQLAKILVIDADFDDVNFGASVAVRNGIVAVSTQDLNNINTTGSISVFDLNGNQLERIVSSDRVSDDQFARSIAIGSNRIVSGAPEKDTLNSGNGRAYIYDLDENFDTYIERQLGY